MVEVTGIEPATSWSQTTRATNCATPRYINHLYNIAQKKHFCKIFFKKIDILTPIDIETGEIMSFSQNTIYTIIIAYDNSIWCTIKEKLYKLYKINAPEKKVYQKTTKTIEEINRSKAHKPAQNHPWRNYKN